MQDGEVDLQYSMGWERRKILICASKTMTPSKCFLHSKIYMLKLLYIVQNCIYTVYFSPLQVKI
jgi:hypothetical protein